MNVLKRGLSVVLVGCLLFTTVPAVASQGAEKVPNLISANLIAQEVSINLRRAKMRMGTKLKLNLSGVSGVQVEWNSTDESVVSVSKWGYMKALKTGKAVVSATYEGKVYKCWVTVIPADLLPTVKLANYKGIDLEDDMDMITSEQFLKDCTFSNITQKDVDDWKVGYKSSIGLIMELLLGLDGENWFNELGVFEEELDQELDTVKSLMFREELAMLTIAEKENLLITPKNLGTYMESYFTQLGIADRYKPFMEKLEKNPKQLEAFCRFISVDNASMFVKKHAIMGTNVTE